MNANPSWHHKSLRRLSTLVVRTAFAAVLALGICVVPAATVKDSADFNMKIEMNVVPIPIYNLNRGWTSDGDVLTFNNAVNTDGAFGWSGQLVNSVGYTIEMRYRITQANTPGTTSSSPRWTFQFQGCDASGANALHTLQVGQPTASGQLGLYSAGSSSATMAIALTAGDWHTLRIADDANSNDVLVWSDGVQITGFNWQSSNNTGNNRAWCGDLGASVTDGFYDVDYYRVDTTGAYAPPAPAVPVATQSPQSITNILGSRMTITGKFSGLVSSVQWYKDNVPLANGSKLTYVIDPATTADSGWYFLRATNTVGTADTLPAYVQVLDVDPTPPAVQSVRGLLTLQNVRVTYTKPTIDESQTNIANYYFQGNALTVLSASRIDQSTVELLTGYQTPGSNYTLFITNVLDTLSNSILPNTSVSFTAPMVNPCVRYDAGTTASQPSGPADPTSATGGYWMQTTNLNNGMATNAVTDDLSTGFNAWQITDQNVISTGGVLDYRMVIDQPSDNLAHASGWRLLTRCRLVDNFSGTAADQLVVYSDTGLGARYGMWFGMDSGGNLTASLLGGSTYILTSDSTSYHTHVLIYDPASAQVSYYFDGQLIVGNYVGQVASGYNGVSFGSASATSSGQMNYNLVQFDVVGGTRPVIVANPQNTTNGVGQKVTFTASFTPFVGAYQWLSNNVVIPRATNTSYTTDFITTGYNGSQYGCRAFHALGNVDTLPATLTVTTDTTPAAIVGVKCSLLLDRVTIAFSEPVQELFATNLANYVWVNPGITNLAAVMLDPLTVELRGTPMPMGSNYTVRVSNVRDTSNLAIAANTPASFTTPWLEVVGRYYAGSTTDAPAGPPDPVSALGGVWALSRVADPDVSTNAISDDLGTGWNAWEVRDASTVSGRLISYTYPLPANVHQFVRQNGWVMSIRSRLSEDFGTAYTMMAGYGDSQAYRNLMFFDLNAGGDLTADLSLGSSFTTYPLTTSGVGAMDYHLHQIVFDPATTNAGYYFDGQAVTRSWSPSYVASSTPGLVWGAGSSASMGAMRYNLVELKTVAGPFVNIQADGPNIKVNYRGVLETVGQLGSPALWSAVATNPAGGTYSAPLVNSTQQFFRARLAQ